MVLLPDTLDIDPGLKEFIERNGINQWRPKDNAEGTRLWAHHFAPLGSSRGIQVPRSWRDFFTNVLLHPDKFAWAKTFLESKAWEMIASVKDGEMCFSFSIPTNCPLQLPIRCSDTQDSLVHDLNCLDSEDLSSESQKLLTPLKQVDPLMDSVATSSTSKEKTRKSPFRGY
jgi:hypothetical protein